MTQAFYRKYRPQNWDDVVGQGHIITVLRNAVAADRVAHAYLFAGPRGTGKTSSARLLAKAVNCLHEDAAARPCGRCEHCRLVDSARFLDLIEIDAASNTSVDDVRSLREKINFSPNQGRFKVYIIDEVHMLSTAAFNALLKTLEEPPSHAIFILATTEAHKIPATVTSRCQRHEFRRIATNEIVAELERLIALEGLEAEEEAVQLIARQATGALRDAISLLDQLSSSGSKITFELSQDVLGTATSQVVLELVEAIQDGQAGVGLDRIHQALDSGADARQFARQIVDYLRDLLLLRMGSQVSLGVSVETRQRMARQAGAFDVPRLLDVIQTFSQAAAELRSAWQPGLALEIALVKAVSREKAAGPAAGQSGTAGLGQAPAKARRRLPEAAPVKAKKADGELDRIRGSWKKIRETVRRSNKATDALLNSCTLLEVRGSELYLGFAGETVKGIMESENHIEFAEQGIESVLGRKMVIRCVIASEAGEIPDDLTSDGMVATSLRLGGKIVHSREASKKGAANQ